MLTASNFALTVKVSRYYSSAMPWIIGDLTAPSCTKLSRRRYHHVTCNVFIKGNCMFVVNGVVRQEGTHNFDYLVYLLASIIPSGPPSFSRPSGVQIFGSELLR